MPAPPSRPRPYRLVIFDFDGTLADSAGWVLHALTEAAGLYNFRRITADEAAMLRGWDNRAIIRYLGVPFWKLPSIARHMRERMAAEADRISLFPGAEETLRGLLAAGARLAIVSSNAEPTVRRILGPELSADIAAFECGASLFGKARRFRRVLRRLGVPPGDAIAIGDEGRDIEAARAAGIDTGAVTWGYATAALLATRRPTVTFERMEELAPRLLGALPPGDGLVLQP
ncbi:HAD hydrolase-like protein [Muricoccus aerilatus]|uniref:HAD hydrolase-like protein n=1 Tax=Muricoccus aerilatus TaxID=452982 RepID=UPI0005C13FFD|nr:HAD hydrolase-like protein [Roseomonas aerilata]